jgi:5-enolpyruvylshikimate-3-phosphate synthase
MIKKLEDDQEINSRDHRVVQAIAMLSLVKNKEANFSFPDCVNKSWPQFWDFLEYTKVL